MPHFPKPAEGSWTEHWPELGTAPVDYTDSYDPQFFEDERNATALISTTADRREGMASFIERRPPNFIGD